MEERTITIWNAETLDWNTKEYIDEHPEYKTKGKTHKFYVWETVLYLAELMGLGSDDIEFLFEKNRNLAIVDLVFSMFLIKLFNRSYAEKYLDDETSMSFKMIHNLIRDAEGYVIDQENGKAVVGGAPVGEAMTEIEKYLKEIAADNTEMQGKLDSVLAELMKKLEVFFSTIKKNNPERKTEAPTDETAKKMQKLEVDNLVLKYQLEHKDAMTQLQMKLAEKEAELKQSEERNQALQKRYEEERKQSEERYGELQKKCEALEKKDEERHGELLSLFKAYEVVVEANTEVLDAKKKHNIFGHSIKERVGNKS